MNSSNTVSSKAAIGFALLLLISPVASADCISLSIENNVLDNAGCELGTTNNDTLNPLQVNTDTMFGFDDWEFAEKVFDADEDIDIGLSLVGGTIGPGTWSINDVWGTYVDVMLVFKDGQGQNTEPQEYVGYLLENGDTSGTYETPFINTNNNNPVEVSHVSAYVRVPEPTSMALLGGALCGLLLGRRRKR